MSLVLSLFPGIGLLDRAFEEEGFCVVRGPDLLWGGDIKTFHPPPGKFDGVIGGPPCQCFSRLRHLVEHNGFKVAENLIPEFARCVIESEPSWWLMENVPAAPDPEISNYKIHSQCLNNRWCGGEQHRKRKFVFGSREGRRLHVQTEALEPFAWSAAVCASGGSKPGIPTDRLVRAKFLGWKTAESLKQALKAQGLPEDFFRESPLTIDGKHSAVGNGVPLPMGRAIAKAVKAANT